MFTSFLRAISKGNLLLLTVALLAGSASVVCGQSALDGFDPNANGTIRDVVVQPDGKILLSGSFTTLSPNGGGAVTRNNIARLNADGTLDIAFNPNANGVLYALAVQPDGKILAGGLFTSIGGQPRHRIARLDATTGLADSFDPNANSEIYSIAVESNGKILVGGLFTSVGGATRNHIARLDPTTGLADSFDPSATNSVTSIVVQADGKIVAGGAFSGANSIGGATRNFIARLDPNTGMADSFDPNANSVVFSLAVQADGKILAGGEFNGANSIGGAARNHIARLDPATGLADSFDPNANGGLASIVVQADGKILVGGLFNDAGNGAISIGGAPRNYIARLDSTTGMADSFNPNANSLGSVYAIAVQADGKILAGGAFTTLAPNGGATTTRNHIARLETDGRLDQTLNLNAVGGYVAAIATQPDGKVLVGGLFTNVLGMARNNIARLNTDGTLDAAFNPNASYGVWAIAVQVDGKILACGRFTSIGGETRNHIARLDAATGLADLFDPNANGEVRSVAVQADGKILAGGYFTSIGGQTRNGIARLDATTGLADSFDPSATNAVVSAVVQPDGKILVGGVFTAIGGQLRNNIARLDAATGLADSFDPNANGSVSSIALQPDGKIVVGGQFAGANSIGGQTRNYLARLDPVTGLADSFDPNANNSVLSLAVQADGKILAGGYLTSIGGQTRNHIARLNATTGLADSFNPNANSVVISITVQTDGKILVGGDFYGANGIGGQTRNLLARLSNDTAALQDLAVTQTAIAWTRGGSSPQFMRVVFESSTDNVTYTPLGNGAATGSNWTMTGQNFPTAQNFSIRARGYYRGGYHGSSESITESLRNAFIAGPTPSPTPIETPSPTPTPIPVPSPTPTPTATPTLTPAPITISGTISYCSNPVPGPVLDVTLTLTGDSGGLATTDGSGNYAFSALAAGGSYTVTPAKAALTPASAGITTIDVLAVQRHFLKLGTPLSGCRLTAADVNGDTAANTVDAIAIQRFYLGYQTGVVNVGEYQFSPASRTYPGLGSNQTGQDYATLVFGDVASPFAE